MIPHASKLYASIFPSVIRNSFNQRPSSTRVWSCPKRSADSVSSLHIPHHFSPSAIMRTSTLVAATAGTIVTGLLGKPQEPTIRLSIFTSSH